MGEGWAEGLGDEAGDKLGGAEALEVGDGFEVLEQLLVVLEDRRGVDGDFERHRAAGVGLGCGGLFHVAGQGGRG